MNVLQKKRLPLKIISTNGAVPRLKKTTFINKGSHSWLRLVNEKVTGRHSRQGLDCNTQTICKHPSYCVQMLALLHSFFVLNL